MLKYVRSATSNTVKPDMMNPHYQQRINYDIPNREETDSEAMQPFNTVNFAPKYSYNKETTKVMPPQMVLAPNSMAWKATKNMTPTVLSSS